MAADIVWTNHLKERLLQRGITRNEAFSAIRHPSQTEKISSNKFKFHKSFSDKKVTIIAVLKDKQWIILTAWSNQDTQDQTKEPLVSRVVRNLLVKSVTFVKNFITGSKD